MATVSFSFQKYIFWFPKTDQARAFSGNDQTTTWLKLI